MAIVSIAELIEKQEEIKRRKQGRYIIDTSIGEIVVEMPSYQLIDDAMGLTQDVDAYLLACTIVEPKLNDKELMQAYGVKNSVDLVKALFPPLEIPALSSVIMDIAGRGKKLTYRLAEDLKKQ